MDTLMYTTILRSAKRLLPLHIWYILLLQASCNVVVLLFILTCSYQLKLKIYVFNINCFKNYILKEKQRIIKETF